MPGAGAARLPAPYRIRATSISSATSSTAGSSSAAGTGTSPTTTSSRRCCARRARARSVVYIPGNHDEARAPLPRARVRRHRDPRRGDSRHRRRPAAAGDARRPLRRRRPLREVAGAAGRRALHVHAARQPALQRARGAPRPAVLVAFAVPEAQGQECRPLHRRASRTRWPARRARAASTASSAATSTRPRSAIIDGVLYCNDGDWVESLTALVEHDDGTLEIVHWPGAAARGATEPRAVPAGAPVPVGD